MKWSRISFLLECSTCQISYYKFKPTKNINQNKQYRQLIQPQRETVGLNCDFVFKDNAKDKVTSASSVDTREIIFELNVYFKLFSSIS